MLNTSAFSKNVNTAGAVYRGYKKFNTRMFNSITAIIPAAFVVLPMLYIFQFGSLAAGIAVGVLLFIGLILGFVVYFYWLGRSSLNLIQFAVDNGFELTTNGFPPNASKKGLVFERGDKDKKYVNVLSRKNYSIGNYTYTIRGSKRDSTNYVGVIAIKLPRELPHTIFDNRRNNIVGSNIGWYSKSQKIMVQSSFDEVFNTYVPEGYAIDVLSYITPELMEMLLKYAAHMDVEIVADQLFLYQSAKFSFTPNVFNFRKKIVELVTSAELLGAELSQNSKSYRDDRVGPVIKANAITSRTKIDTTGKQLRYSSKPYYLYLLLVFSIVGLITWITYKEELHRVRGLYGPTGNVNVRHLFWLVLPNVWLFLAPVPLAILSIVKNRKPTKKLR